MKRGTFLLGIDVGTSSCKTILFSPSGNIISSASCEYPTIIKEEGWAEQEPGTWWISVKTCIKEVIMNSKIHPSDIASIGIDCQGSAVVPVDSDGNTIGNALIWMDRRSEQQCRWMEENIGQDLLTRINGNRDDPSNYGPKLLWFKQNEPWIYKNTYKFLSVSGFLVYRLTRAVTFSITEGGLSQIFDIKQGIWSDELIKLCGLDKEKLPEIYNSFDIAGRITREVSNETGLCEGTPVIAGAMDAVACALGCGVVSNCDAFITGGTVTCVGICSDRPLYNANLHTYHHIIPGNWINAAGVDYGGGSFRWYRDNLFNPDNREDLSYNTLDIEAMEAEVGSNKLIFVPYMVGQRTPLWDSNTRGMFFGISPSHTRKHFTRAIMEGNAYGVNYILKLFEEMGICAANVKLSGGCAKGPVWRKIFADILAQKINIPVISEVTAFGIALTAGVGAGVYKDFSEALKIIKYEDVDFDNRNVNIYRKLYKVYSGLYPLLKDKYAELAGIDNEMEK